MVHNLTRYGLLCLMLLTTTVVQAQYFGRNKPAYKKFDFKVMESPNFKLYHYFDNQQDALKVIQDSERWYKLHQLVLKDTIAEPNPLIIYKNHADFQQTTAISGAISVGTGGVTEGLKNRVVMPITLSNKQTDHVLGHELVHAFQYNMMRTGDSLSLNSMRNLPLWMVEGLAEYMSIGHHDPNTAMWMRDAVLHKDIPSLKDLTRKPQYFPYRWGQAFWSFVAGTWGDQVIEPLFLNTAKYGYEAAIDTVLNLDAVTLGNMWKTKLQDYYKPYISSADSIATGNKLLHKENAGRLNISPVLSPNGKFIAYMSDQNVLGLDLYLADARTGKVVKQLASLSKNEHLDNFNFMESAGTFSPHGNRFAFVVFEQGVNKLAIVDVARGKIIENIRIPGVDAFAYPAWSPDGQSIVVSGLGEMQSDLYLYDLRSKKTTRLTNDAYSDLMPGWSADGTKLVFATDRPVGTQTDNKSSYNLAELTIATGSIKVADVFAGADNLNPVYEPNSDNILFLSDRDGYRNMYRYIPGEQRVEQLTEYVTGISGITAFSPALSVARDVSAVAYSHYKKGDYSIFTAPLAQFKGKEVDKNKVEAHAGVLPPLERNKPLIAPNLAKASTANPASIGAEYVSEKAYKPEFKLDHISNTAGVGIGASTGPYGAGLNGGINMLFSDVLGTNQLFAAASLNGQIYDFGAQVGYLRQVGRFKLGAQIGHVPFMSGLMGFTQDSIQLGDKKELVDNVILQQIRMFQQSANLIGNYVFSTTRRLEFGGGISRYSYRIDQYNNYYKDGLYIRTKDEKLDAPEPFHFEQAFVAYVGDNSTFGLTSPLAGRRFRLHAERYFGEFNFWTGIVDYRHYVFVKPFAIAFRALHQTRIGGDAESGRLGPLSIAHPTFVRGYGNGYFNKSQKYGYSNVSFSNLYGNRIAVANAEIRLPFTGPERLALIKSGFFLTDLNLFVDAGMAWSPDKSTTESWGLTAETGSHKPLVSAGASVRVNLFGYMVIEPFYAIPLEKNGLKLASFGINFAPGW
ncbi:BamA/TamA family outer membrane protein [Pontibacter cellulosilyticus]|uniref:PD40 domain-containing protein n=1 Tax=Pontibacter cellulosilyticus TaxID=1720253 RepID=A0A923N868_9BACT|nr:BamA/TamA family outer membrane protein [Pontibacter cellulosilyticus]MBC5993196.1 PD40 domain-containing protein [Pontibacter cellulosilyticus]